MQSRNLTVVSGNEAILKGVCYLADCCDGARSDDGAGFNKADSYFGLAIASQIRDKQSLNYDVMVKVLGRIRKYKKQLERAGIELPEAVEWFPDRVATKASKPVLKKRPGVVVEIRPGAADEPAVKQWEAPEWAKARPWLESEYRQPLSENQKQAFDAAHEWFFGNPDDRNGKPFVLKGYAGTGKSYTCQRIVLSIDELVYRYVKPRYFDVAMAAPTHKAAQVLRDFAEGAGLDFAYVNTIHSLLHVKPGYPDKDGKRKLAPVKSSKPHYSGFGLVVVDEASMIGRDIYDLIQLYEVPTIFMGDPAQLVPVEEEDEKQEEKEGNSRQCLTSDAKLSPTFALPSAIELTEVLRYDGDLARYATQLREDLNRSGLLPIQNGDNIIKINHEQKWLDLLFAKVDKAQHAREVRAISWTNARMSAINEAIRNRLFDCPDSRFVDNELVMAKEAIMIPSSYDSEERETAMYSCSDAVVERVETVKGYEWDHLAGVQEFINKARFFNLDQSGLICYELELSEMAQPIITPCRLDLAEPVFTQWVSWIRSDVPEQQRSKEWAKYYRAQEDLNVIHKGKKLLYRLQYAYAITAHQSQGSTYDYVFMDTPDISKCWMNEIRNRLFYVAATRAKKLLIAL